MDETRIERLIAALASATVDDFVEARSHLAASGYDALGALEDAIRLFIDRLATTTAQNAHTLSELAAAKAAVDEKLRTIERQQAAIHELQASVIDVWSGILLLPVVGSIDVQRVSHMTEHLLLRVASSGKIEWVILDLTGVSGIDSLTARRLLHLSQAVRLLGVRCIVTGIGAELARVLVDVGSTLNDLVSFRALRDGLAYCMDHSAQARTRGSR